MKSAIRMAALAAAVALFTCSPVAAQEYENAKARFSDLCATCHGEHGRGDGPSVGIYNIHPRNFTDCATMRKLSDETLFKAIHDGGAAVGISNSMPRWREMLSDQQIKELIVFIRTFCKQGPPRHRAAKPPASETQ